MKAHAMEPHQGTGAGQAIEVSHRILEDTFIDLSFYFQDAYLLATLLGQRAITMSSISRALRAYDAIRRPFVNDIARRNRLTGYQFMFLGDNFDWDNCPDEVLRSRLQYLGGNITNNWDWTWLTTIDELMEEGIRLL